MTKYYIALSFFLSIFEHTFSQNRRIIDVHFHTRSAGDYGPLLPANPVSGKIPRANTNVEILSSNIILLKKYNVIKAICSGTLERNREYIKADSLRFLSSLEYPDHQNNPLPDTTTFIKLFREKKFLVFGELGLQYEGQTLDDPQFAPYLSICERLGIPVAVHTGEAAPNTPFTCCPKFTIESGRPLRIEPVLKRYPMLKVQLMHMGFPFLEETKALLNVYPQLYVDVSAINWLVPKEEFYSYLQSLIRAGFENRIMYGSDQMIWEDAIAISIERIEHAPFLSGKQKDDIFYNNAKRFFHLH
jgi:predicted TIM-barrel fold metal-dependent hydrolase